MRNTLIFTKRVIKEILRDPIIYIFGIGFPLVMLLLFQIINNYTGEENERIRKNRKMRCGASGGNREWFTGKTVGAGHFNRWSGLRVGYL